MGKGSKHNVSSPLSAHKGASSTNCSSFVSCQPRTTIQQGSERERSNFLMGRMWEEELVPAIGDVP